MKIKHFRISINLKMKTGLSFFDIFFTAQFDMSTRCCLQSFGCFPHHRNYQAGMSLKVPFLNLVYYEMISRIEFQEYTFKLYSNIPVFKNIQDFWSSRFVKNLCLAFLTQWRHGNTQQLLMDVCCGLPVSLTADTSQRPTAESASQLEKEWYFRLAFLAKG